MITGCLIVVCLIVGILIPDIELVLGLVGSTMGSCICVIFPGMMFLKLTNKDTTERLASRAIVVIGKLYNSITRCVDAFSGTVALNCQRK